ncbi:MAG: potassium channel protein, partial [Bacteroidota bacterium]|nr:potassium channel protein [Bacteroidota bacterium]
MKRLPPLIVWFAVILSITMIGVIGFMLIEGFNFFDALYMTVITITTIGYGEVRPLSHAGRIFNICFIITSFATFTYALARLTRYIASGEMQLYFKNRKLMLSLSHLHDHVIICGFGRNGQQAAQTLNAHKENFVAIDYREKNIDDFLADHPNLLYLKGDATNDEILKKARIENAKALICALPTDADNVFIVLSARTLNPSIHIISRATQISAVDKLKKAGADNVIMPDKIGGTHMATLVSKPDVVEFIDYLSGDEGESINIESVGYEKLPPEIRDDSLKAIMDWKKTGVNCIGIKHRNGKFLINPPDDTVITEGMKVFVLGTRSQIHKMKHNVGEE